MSLVDDLYQEIILDHYQSPRNRQSLDNPDVHVQGMNPLCGDELDLTLKLKDGILAEIGIAGRGCSISIASASLMSEAIKGKPLAEVMTVIDSFKGMLLRGEAPAWDEEYEELAALEGVKQLPVRIKCALLGWDTLLQGLKADSHEATLVVTE